MCAGSQPGWCPRLNAPPDIGGVFIGQAGYATIGREKGLSLICISFLQGAAFATLDLSDDL
jgi:hypothetical protein